MGAGSRRSSPLASLAPSHLARSGGARRLQLPASLKQPAGAPSPPGVLGLVSASSSSQKLELPKHGPSGSSGAKRGAATPTSSPLPYATRQAIWTAVGWSCRKLQRKTLPEPGSGEMPGAHTGSSSDCFTPLVGLPRLALGRTLAGSPPSDLSSLRMRSQEVRVGCGCPSLPKATHLNLIVPSLEELSIRWAAEPGPAFD